MQNYINKKRRYDINSYRYIYSYSKKLLNDFEKGGKRTKLLYPEINLYHAFSGAIKYNHINNTCILWKEFKFQFKDTELDETKEHIKHKLQKIVFRSLDLKLEPEISLILCDILLFLRI